MTVSLYAAGSLRGPLTDIAKVFEAATGTWIAARFGPSGTLRDEIMAGAKTDIFASANMDHPRALHDAGIAGPVVLFTRNTMCGLVAPALDANSDSLLEHMLDGAINVGSSTPKADPSGDYAFEVFRKADALRPGSTATLESKVKLLTGDTDSATPPPGRNVYGWHVAEGRADIFITYRTNAVIAVQENPDQRIVALPDALAVNADYGLTVMRGASQDAERFAALIVSPEGEAIFTRYGFASRNSR
jgi:molybdenum ABC transporter molybdate-binding protein